MCSFHHGNLFRACKQNEFLHQEQFSLIKSYVMRILVVDDNSPDGTQDIVKTLMRRWDNIDMITGPKEGLGKAYIRGMDYAINHLHADIIYEMDADFQHHPKQIPQFLKKLEQGYDIVVGARYIPGGSVPKNWGLHRKIFSRVGNLLVRLVLMRFNHHEWTNGYRIICAPTYLQVRSQLLEYTGYTFQVAFLHQAFLLGKKIGEIPNRFDERRYGRSKIGSEYVKNLLLYLTKQTIINPPRILRFVIVGGVGFVVQFIVFRLLRSLDLRPSLATIFSAEIAIISNFIWSNLWTFAERKVTTVSQFISKFFQFNLTSIGSILIQAGISEAGTRVFGIKHLALNINTDDVYLIVGILIGMIWNYTMYSRVIWRKKWS